MNKGVRISNYEALCDYNGTGLDPVHALRLVRLDLNDARGRLRAVQGRIAATRAWGVRTSHTARMLRSEFRNHKLACDTVWRLQREHETLMIAVARLAGGQEFGPMTWNIQFNAKTWARFVGMNQ